ncbi:hypothetical protein [Dyadobacter sp. OTU695]|uniref:hypothetical protein n=1 Tax=Dyadobacter sp. OTU695 TaxID=3043860 RepID=UPI00313CD45F
MERADQKHILVLITNPFAVLNSIHSGLMGQLEKNYRISIISDLLTKADIDRFNEHFQLNMRLLDTRVPTISRFGKWLRAVQTLLHGYHFGIETIRIKIAERSPIFHRLFLLSGKSRLPALLTGLGMTFVRNWLIRRTTLPDTYAPLATCNFLAVVSTSPFDLRENTIANSLTIPRISIIISWDNLTSKGVMNTKSDLVLVWNKPMALEYQRLYASFGDHAAVRITGIPRFDIYFRERPLQNSNLAGTIWENPVKRVILFSTGAVKHHSCQNYIISDLLEYAESRPDTVILVRCHPGDDPERYAHFGLIKKLHFFHPFGENPGHVPPADFLEMLHLQLVTCDVCVQVASTMFLDAAACRKPCISIAYDAHSSVHYAGSVRRFYDYSHQLPLYKILDGHIVHNRGELFRKLDEILVDPNVQADPGNAVKPFIHHCAPDSTRLAAQYIREWLG